MKDPYETLDIPEDSPPEVIKKAYRKAAKKKHPDSGGKADEMAEIAQAYMVLSNPEKKKQYDETGDVGPDDTQSRIYAEFCQL